MTSTFMTVPPDLCGCPLAPLPPAPRSHASASTQSLWARCAGCPPPLATGVQRFGPAADEVERFISLLRDQPVTVWERAKEYRHNLELNPTVHEELVSKYRSLLDLGRRTGRSAALRAAAEAALDALPTRIHAAWELATIVAAWAVALSDLLPAAELKVFCRAFDALRPDAPNVSRPPPGFAQPSAARATEASRAEAA